MNITFEKADKQHRDVIFAWLAEPHMLEFWDNSQAHKDDICNFIDGKKQHYFYGTTKYWVGLINQEPYCFLLSDILQTDQNLSKLHQKNMSVVGHTISLDFGIGNTKYLRQGLAAATLKKFISYYKEMVDPLADTFFIDPDENNPRAKHIYIQAGFEQIGKFDVQAGAFAGNVNCLMVKRL